MPRRISSRSDKKVKGCRCGAPRKTKAGYTGRQGPNLSSLTDARAFGHHGDGHRGGADRRPEAEEDAFGSVACSRATFTNGS